MSDVTEGSPRTVVARFLRDCLRQDEADAIAENLSRTLARDVADLNIAVRRLGQETMIAYFPTWYLRAWATKYYGDRPGYDREWAA